MSRHLTVTQAFGPYAKGDQITDAKAIEDALASHPGSVVHATHAPAEDKAPDKAPEPPAAPSKA